VNVAVCLALTTVGPLRFATGAAFSTATVVVTMFTAPWLSVTRSAIVRIAGPSSFGKATVEPLASALKFPS
jgi:hypothetical protein